MDKLSADALQSDNQRQLITEIIRGVVGIPEGSPSEWGVGDVAGLAANVVPVGRVAGAGVKAAKAAVPAAERLAIQGGALASKPSLDKIRRALEDHSIDFEDLGGKIVARTPTVDVTGRRGWEQKTFDESTSLQTLRNWLGY